MLLRNRCARLDKNNGRKDLRITMSVNHIFSCPLAAHSAKGSFEPVLLFLLECFYTKCPPVTFTNKLYSQVILLEMLL